MGWRVKSLILPANNKKMLMRIKVVLIFLVLFIAYQGITQNKPFRFGVKVAPTIAWIAPDAEGYENDGSELGFSWGLLADFALAENYFVKTGFSMDYLNGKLQFPYLKDDLPGTMNRTYHLRYLEIPLTLKMRTNKFGRTAYFGEIGFGTSFNIRAKSDDEFMTDVGAKSTSEEDIKDEIAFFKESLIVGAGMEYFLDESTSLVFELSFHNGLTDILTDYNTRNPEVKQNGILYYFQFNVGIIF
jgi:hypothetical protein